jgi:hypothetical protein
MPRRGGIFLEVHPKNAESSARSDITMANTYTQIYIHIVFAVKEEKILSGENAKRSCTSTLPG